MPAAETLSLRQLNRATLARQMLLARAQMTPSETVEQVLGLQAQLARPPIVGLWSRLAGVDRREVVDQLMQRRLVRAPAMRATLHVMTAVDYLRFRRTLQPCLDRAISVLKDRAADLELERLVELGRAFFATPQTFDAFRDALARRHPTADVRAMAYAVRTRLPVVQVPIHAGWGFPAQADFITADAWLGKSPADGDYADELVIRYLQAFGPATVADVQAWSGLAGLKRAIDSLGSRLREFGGPGRATLFDLPDAPRPDGTMPAPVRFLPEWDNVIVSRADERLVPREYRAKVFRPGLRVLPTVLVDGFVAGLWKVQRRGRAATLVVEPFAPLTKRARAEVEQEADTLIRFVEPDAARSTVLVR
ncbi:MAG: winged helix DNA-binding domain-containing protein [Acidobacteria bacterium]|nr:winged helix DNA-binding domain-containing protein [Acidobacteriota bacterium]